MPTLIDHLSAPWAIMPERLSEIQAIYAAHFRGDKIDLDAVEARLGRPLASEQKAYGLVDGTGVAVLEISGVISPKANMFTRVSGGAVAALLQQQVQSMASDNKVKAVVINADSPGGAVLGIPALASAVRELAAAKPCVTVATGMICSAMYWVGSAANAVYLSGETDYAGSLGVVATHNYSPRGADVQKTEVTAGKYKRIVSDSAPLTAEGRAYMQAQVDEIYRVFVDTVALQRGVSAEQVLAHMADGRVFIGQQAVDAGLADGFSTVDAMVEQLATNPSAFAARRRAVFAASPSSVRSATPATPATPALPHPNPAAGAAADVPAAGPVLPASPAVQPAKPPGADTPMPTPQETSAAFAAEHPEAVALLRAEGAATERSRINAVREQSLPGHEALVEQLAFDGKTTGPEAASQVLQAERGKLAGIANNRRADAPARLPNAEAGTNGNEASSDKPLAGADFINNPQAVDKAAKDYMAAHPGTQYLAAVNAVTQGA